MDTRAVRLAALPRAASPPYELLISLSGSESEIIRELMLHEEGPPRDDYALSALKIGVLALKQARGQIDGDTIRREGENLLGSLQGKLEIHTNRLDEQLKGTLKDYFDPESGRFHERVQRLVKKDGELEDVLRRQIGLQDSELCKTLAAHVGQSSPLMKILSPKESEGLMKSLRDALTEALADQRQRVLAEFTLDQPNSALSRLVKTLTDKHGDVGKDLQSKIDEVVKEFSLNNEDSALSLMTRQLKSTSEVIDNHLTLDKETSALSRLRRELLELLKGHSDANLEFQSEIKKAIGELQVRREAARRSPEHGKDFERIAFEFVQDHCQRAGHVVDFTADRPGLIRGSKVGDIVIEWGPDHAAAASRVVIEAKDKKAYALTEAREEIETARKNRGAAVGLFAFAKPTAPVGLEPFQRLGDDLFIVWDADDAASDIYFKSALMVAEALCTRQAKQREAQAVDFGAIDLAINEIEKRSKKYADVRSAAESIKKNADNILDRVRIDGGEIEKQLAALREHLGDLKTSLVDPATGAPAGK